MKKKSVISHLSVSEQEFNELLAKQNYLCNAEGRKKISKKVKVLSPRPIPETWTHHGWFSSATEIDTDIMLFHAREIGGCECGQRYEYPTPHGIQRAVVTMLSDAFPQNPEAPTVVVRFSGNMNPWVAMEVIRFYAKRYGELPEFLAIGKADNKGLFDKLYNRKKGFIIGSEAEAYCNIMSLMAPESYARKHQQTFNDISTAENLRELYRFAKEKDWKEANFILVTGQPWYDRRLLSEWMLMLREEEFADVKLNLTLAHSPIWLQGNSPDTKLSEISLASAAACLWPLTKDTVPLVNGLCTKVKQGERYLLPDLLHPNLLIFEELIRKYNASGWPNGSEVLFKTSHEEAVKEVMLAHLFAEASFSPEDYDEGVFNDILLYQQFVGEFDGATEQEFLQWCINTPDQPFA